MNKGLSHIEKKRLHKFLSSLAYGGNHDTNGDYLNLDELKTYLHKEINNIMRDRRNSKNLSNFKIGDRVLISDESNFYNGYEFNVTGVHCPSGTSPAPALQKFPSC